MTRKTKLILIAVCLVALFAGVALALPRGKGGRPGGGPAIEKHADELEITDKQIDKLRDIRYEHEDASIVRRAELEKAELEMKRLMEDKDFDRGKIYAQAEKVTRLEREMKLARVDGILATFEVLTDEQREDLRELKEERAEDFRERMQERRGGGRRHERFREDFED